MTPGRPLTVTRMPDDYQTAENVVADDRWAHTPMSLVDTPLTQEELGEASAKVMKSKFGKSKHHPKDLIEQYYAGDIDKDEINYIWDNNLANVDKEKMKLFNQWIDSVNFPELSGSKKYMESPHYKEMKKLAPKSPQFWKLNGLPSLNNNDIYNSLNKGMISEEVATELYKSLK
jgi:hypothetical protein